jgi:hypothetical protein
VMVVRGCPPCLGKTASIPLFPPSAVQGGQEKEIKLVLKEGHLARVRKGPRNPLFWGTFKWGKVPTQASILQGTLPPVGPLSGSSPSSFTSPRFVASWLLDSTLLSTCFLPLKIRLGQPRLQAAWRRHLGYTWPFRE